MGWILFIALLFCESHSKKFFSYSREVKKTLPLVLSAMKGEYYRGGFKATGCVKVYYQKDILYADTLIYEPSPERLIAQGNVRLQTAEGDILVCEKAILTPDLSKGSLFSVRLLSHLREHMTAQRLFKKDQETLVLEKGSYTPCEQCRDYLSPLWALHAEKITYNQRLLKVSYEATYLSFFGIPVAYVPYFYLPTQKSKGFLSPFVSKNPSLGIYLGIPYYYPFTEKNDLTITPFIMEKEGLMVAQEYRHLFSKGKLMLKAAINKPLFYRKEEKPLRGYGESIFDYPLTTHWRLRSHELWTSDKTFLSTRPFFGYEKDPYLSSQTVLEGFYPHHFIQCRGLRYKRLQESIRDPYETIPFIYPEINYWYHSPFISPYGFFSMNAHTLSLHRKRGARMQRITTRIQWKKPWISSGGHEWTFFTRFYDSFYYIPRSLGKKSYSTKWRLVPQGGIKWKFPSRVGSNNFIPCMQWITSLPRVNRPSIPNEDSQIAFFDERNLLSSSRYSGKDRFDEGTRLNYGLHWQRGEKYFLHSFLGQSFSFSKPDPFLNHLGIQKGLSSCVGKLHTVFKHFSLLYYFRWDYKKKTLPFQQIGWDIGPPLLAFSGSYGFSKAKSPSFLSLRYNQIFASVSSQWTPYWKGRIFFSRDLKMHHERGKLLDKGVEVVYQDECFSTGLTFHHSYYRMEDIRPGYTISFFLCLKNIGCIHHRNQSFMDVK